jgi:hypothetical protein
MLCLGLWCLGVLALIAGVWGDTTGWWTDRNFLANLASSITGALFGIPFALVVIGYITARQGDERERREATRQASQLAHELANDARHLIRDTPAGVGALGLALRQAREALERFARGQEAEAQTVRRAYTLWHEVISPRAATQLSFDRMLYTWRALKDDARPRLARVDVAWLDRELVDLLDHILASVPADGADLYWMDELTAGEEVTAQLLRSRRAAQTHLQRIERADQHLRTAERLGRYTEEVFRHLSRQDRARSPST